MTVPVALALLSLVICGAMVASRWTQRGYIDYLTPLLALYFIHSVTRAWFDQNWPELVSLNPIVQLAGEEGIVDALLLTTGCLVALTFAYLSVTRFRVCREPSPDTVDVPRLDLAVGLLVVGLACRAVLRADAEGLIHLPESLATPTETLGWTALAGVFLLAYRWGRLAIGTSARHVAAFVSVSGTVLVLVVDWRFVVSREGPLQVVLALLVGRIIGGNLGLRRLALLGVALSLPVFVWIGAMKTYQNSQLGEGRGYVEGVSTVRAEKDQSWTEFVVSSTQSRFHGLDSIIVCRRIVPELQPYEEGSIWKQVFVSAFVPRALYRTKSVGWGIRFAVEFWGLPQETAGSAAVGISQIGNFYVYGGVLECLAGMAVLGWGLGILAELLRHRRDAFGFMMFFLTAVTICQVDRDLEVVLGGILKLLAIFTAVLLVRRAHAAFSGVDATRGGTEYVRPTAELG